MPVKKWIIIVSVIAVSGIAFVWMKGASQTDGRDIRITSTSSNVPAPGPGQKKVVLKNLGMT